MKNQAVTFIFITLLFIASPHYSQEKLIQADCDFDCKNISILAGDVLEYFNLSKTYDSSLKKKVFLKSEEGLILRDSLKKLKKNILKKRYTLSFTTKFPNYNVEKGGFYIHLYEGDTQWESEINYITNRKNTINCLYFNKLPLKIMYGYFSIYQSLFIRCSEKDALKLENNTATISIYFDIGSKTKTSEDNRGLFAAKDMSILTQNVKILIKCSGEEIINKKY